MGHGAMLTLGAYLTWASTTAGLPFLLAAPLAALGVAVIALLLEHSLIRHFYRNPFETLILTWGFFLVATEAIKIVFGTDFRSVPSPLPGTLSLFGLEVPAYRACVALFSLGLLVTLGLVYRRTTFGLRIRARGAERRGRQPARAERGAALQKDFRLPGASCRASRGLL